MTRRFWSDEAAEAEVDRREYAEWAEAQEPCDCEDCGPIRR